MTTWIVQEKRINIMDKLEDKIGALIEQLEKGIDFSKGQAPIIIEQVLAEE
jgi:hypothetical protein